MNGKGDKPRPFSIDRDTYEDNWDRIFKKKSEQDDDMWVHNCKHNGKISTAKGEPCNWCDVTEEQL